MRVGGKKRFKSAKNNKFKERKASGAENPAKNSLNRKDLLNTLNLCSEDNLTLF